METIQITEGRAKLVVPKASFKDPFHLEVFYNPKMQFNRSISAVAFNASLPLLPENPSVVDGLCSLGARGIRYYLEAGGKSGPSSKKRFFFVDANNDAMKHLKKNIKLNKLRGTKVSNEDLNKFFLSSDEYFDFIEIDPFGSPVFFLESAIRRAKKTAVLSVTATDLANLAGARMGPCLRHYAARPLKCEYAHEIALRILLGKMAFDAAKFDYSIKPLFSFYQLHFVKAMVFLEKGADKADSCLKQIGFISRCQKCLHRETGKTPKEKCRECGSELDYAGPLWLGELCEGEFISRMQALNSKVRSANQEEISRVLALLLAECGMPPTFYDLHCLSRSGKSKIGKLADVVKKLEQKGFKASKTHFSTVSVRTNAPLMEVKKAAMK